MTMNTEEFSTTGEGGAERIKEAAGGVASEAGRAAETRASQTMVQLGDTLEQVAQAVREAGNGMREQQPQVANVADTAAQQVERASQYLREHDAREAFEAVQTFARRQPLALAGGGLALGVLAGRLLKAVGGSGSSSSSSQYGQGSYSGYGQGYDQYADSYAGGTYGGSSFGGSSLGTTGDATTGYGLTDGAGASTIASGQPIEAGGAIDTGFGSTPAGDYDRDIVGLADDTSGQAR